VHLAVQLKAQPAARRSARACKVSKSKQMESLCASRAPNYDGDASSASIAIKCPHNVVRARITQAQGAAPPESGLVFVAEGTPVSLDIGYRFGQ